MARRTIFNIMCEYIFLSKYEKEDSEVGHRVHAFLEDLTVQGSHHSLFVFGGKGRRVVGEVDSIRGGEVPAHGFDDCIACATVPFVGPGLEVHHSVRLAVSDHHYLSKWVGTFLPEPPARTSLALKVLMNFSYSLERRLLLVATTIGLCTLGLTFLSQLLPLKSKASFSLTEPIVTTGSYNFSPSFKR